MAADGTWPTGKFSAVQELVAVGEEAMACGIQVSESAENLESVLRQEADRKICEAYLAAGVLLRYRYPTKEDCWPPSKMEWAFRVLGTPFALRLAEYYSTLPDDPK